MAQEGFSAGWHGDPERGLVPFLARLGHQPRQCMLPALPGRAEAIRDADAIWTALQILEDREGSTRVRFISRYIAWVLAPDSQRTGFVRGADRGRPSRHGRAGL